MAKTKPLQGTTGFSHQPQPVYQWRVSFDFFLAKEHPDEPFELAYFDYRATISTSERNVSIYPDPGVVSAKLDFIESNFIHNAKNEFVKLWLEGVLLDPNASKADKKRIRTHLESFRRTHESKGLTQRFPQKVGPDPGNTAERKWNNLVENGHRGLAELVNRGRNLKTVTPQQLSKEMYPDHRAAYDKLMRELRFFKLSFKDFMKKHLQKI